MKWFQMNWEELNVWLAALGMLALGAWIGQFLFWVILKMKGLI